MRCASTALFFPRRSAYRVGAADSRIADQNFAQAGGIATIDLPSDCFHATQFDGTLKSRRRCVAMRYTQHDLEIAGQHVRALQRFIQEQKQRLAESTWGPELNAEAERLLAQFEAALLENRRRYQEIWSVLHSALPQKNSGGSPDEPTS